MKLQKVDIEKKYIEKGYEFNLIKKKRKLTDEFTLCAGHFI